MKQIAYDGHQFINREQKDPLPKGFDMLISIQAIAVNPVDIKQKIAFAAGEQAPLKFKVLGYDALGIVEKLGDKAHAFKVGERIFYAGQLNRDGCNADKQLVDARLVSTAPKTLSNAQAAALPLTAITAWEMLFERLRINTEDAGKSILFIGAAGGVGSMAIQLAKKIAKLHVIATASRKQTQQWCKKMGADTVITHHEIAAYFQQHPQPEYIVCLTEPDAYFKIMADTVKPQGSICLIANAQKPQDINLLKNKNITLVWEFMAMRAMIQSKDMSKQGEILKKIAQLIDQGVLAHTLNETINGINTDTIAAAHKRIAQGNVIGKLALTADS